MNKGLSSKEVEESRKKYGNNSIKIKSNNSFFKLLLESFGDPIIKILLIVLAIKIIVLIKDFNWYENIGIFIAIFLATLISTISEYGSEAAYKKLVLAYSKVFVPVKRDNKVIKINIDDVVVGDIILLESGSEVAADGIIVEGNISVSMASLNGESKEVFKKINNEVLRGSIITEGKCLLKVTKVGLNTTYGEIASSLLAKVPDTPLKIRLTKLAKTISRIGYIGAFLGVISFLFSKIVISNSFNLNNIINYLSVSKNVMDLIIYSITLGITIIVVAVPEGLPLMVTLVLASNMKRMIKKNVLVRKKEGIETSGNITYLLTDKTGTITKGNLHVDAIYDSSFNKFILNNDVLSSLINDNLLYNNESYISDNEVMGGNSTDKAILSFCNNKEKIKKVSNVTQFNSIHKYSSCCLDNKMLVKGSVDVIIQKCNSYIDRLGNKNKLINSKSILLKVSNSMSMGKRVIALAYKDNSINTLFNLTLLGFVVLSDEIRKTAAPSIKAIKNAFINVIMVTGDSKETALYVAKESHIYEESSYVISSEELNKYSDEDLIKVIDKIKVIYGAMPNDKKRIVELLQSKNEIVAMTGDGINDAPALRKANVGFAMGSGTEVAKEASDIIILDNDIKSIVDSILFGRTIFKSIRKFLIFQLTINICALSTAILGPLFGISTPITIIQMLWINMIMDTLSGIAFAYEPTKVEYLEEKPKDVRTPIIDKHIYIRIFIMGITSSIICLLFLLSNFTTRFIRSDNKYFMTAYFALFIFMGIFNAFNARSERINIFKEILKSKIFLLVMLFISVVQVIMIYYGSDVFRTYGLQTSEFIYILIISFLVVPIDIIRKLFFKKKLGFDLTV